LRELPSLTQDRSFWGMTATQFLGAFNDNLFKQLVLLICVDYAIQGDTGYQSQAMALFAIPFVLFSGLGGYLSDRYSKRYIVVLCKVAEIAVMVCGCVAFLSGQLSPLFAVLFLMSTQSAFFGPAKYGILPELFREGDLPQANGIIQMTTFMAIIFGMAFAGICKDWFESQLWVTSVVCIGIAVIGTMTSLFIRRTPIAHPRLPFSPSSLGINHETWKLLRSDRPLLGVLLVSSLFWFVGGVVQPTVNAFGKLQMGYGDTRTSFLAACMGIGIAIGCVLAGRLSRGRVSFPLVRIGAGGITVCLAAMSAFGWIRSESNALLTAEALEWPARAVLTLLGVSAGLFVVPLQVFLQARPPEDQKGRMIGAMNLINWIGIVLSAAFFGICQMVLTACEIVDATEQPAVTWIFAAVALVMLPVAFCYRPHSAVKS
jgi:MFS family permease